MLRAVTTGAYFPPVVTIWNILTGDQRRERGLKANHSFPTSEGPYKMKRMIRRSCFQEIIGI